MYSYNAISGEVDQSLEIEIHSLPSTPTTVLIPLPCTATNSLFLVHAQIISNPSTRRLPAERMHSEGHKPKHKAKIPWWFWTLCVFTLDNLSFVVLVYQWTKDQSCDLVFCEMKKCTIEGWCRCQKIDKIILNALCFHHNELAVCWLSTTQSSFSIIILYIQHSQIPLYAATAQIHTMPYYILTFATYIWLCDGWGWLFITWSTVLPRNR